MTLGEHIQTLRKEKGLSQEALGDALGVTRQSISRWESDGAIPEVEKLIALSKLFGVPVGVLLQVEEVGEEPPHELTERELAAVEAIVEKYLSKLEQIQPKPQKRRKWPLVLLLFVLLFAAWQFSAWNSSIQSRINSLQNDLSYVERNISSQVNNISSEVESILERQNAITADESYTIDSMDLRAATITFSLSATPRDYVEGMTALFTAQLGSGDTASAEGVLDPTTKSFSADLTCELTDDISLSVAFRSGETTQTRLLGRETHLLHRSYPSLHSHSGMNLDHIEKDGSYRLEAIRYVECDPGSTKTAAGGYESVPLVRLDLLFYLDGVLVHEVTDVDLSDAADSPIHRVHDIPINFTFTGLKEGSTILTVARGTDSCGRVFTESIDCMVAVDSGGDHLELMHGEISAPPAQ